MKKLATTLLAIVVTLLISFLPVIGDEGGNGKTMGNGQQDQKNECLLVTRKCGDLVDSIQKRVDRIRGEIARGSTVYTPAELKKLNDKLEEASKTLDSIIYHAGGG